MSISDRVYLARAAGKLFQSTYKHNIATLNRKVNYYFLHSCYVIFAYSRNEEAPKFYPRGFV